MVRLRWLIGLLLAVGECALPVANADDAAIQQAIQRGVQYIKQTQQPGGNWEFEGGHPGMTALAGLTLLECGVPATDHSVRSAALLVRQVALRDNSTYFLALAASFLDRLGDPADEPLLDSIMARLRAGQLKDGGWSYQCPALPERDIRTLRGLEQGHAELVGDTKAPRGKNSKTNDEPKSEHNFRARMIAVSKQLRLPRFAPQQTDHSNTQFAALGLWIGRRHGFPVDEALKRVAKHFRRHQHRDGGWGYLPDSEVTTASMTCAGLFILGIEHGTRVAALRAGPTDKKSPPAKKKVAKDPAIEKALRVLGTLMTFPEIQLLNGRVAGGEPLPGPGGPRFRRGGPMGGRGGPPLNVGPMSRPGSLNCYFLWSLERVGTAFGLQTVGGRDWYAWGSDLLLRRQQADGGWSENYSGTAVDTCFALLFLRRANLVRDLTVTLHGRVQDPGNAMLRAGVADTGPARTVQPSAKPARQPADASAATPKPVPPPADSKASVPKSTTPAAAPRKEEVEEEEDATQLAADLVHATGSKRSQQLDRLRTGKGGRFTQALAVAVPRLEEPDRGKVRDALAERLTRMSAATLRSYLGDENREIRSAAALACGMKEDRAFVPDLILLLQDKDTRVARAADVALQHLTNQKLKTAADWQKWWQTEGKAKRP